MPPKFSLPKIYDKKGDLKKQWLVRWSVRQGNTLVPHKEYVPMKLNRAERYAWANEVKAVVTQALLTGKFQKKKTTAQAMPILDALIWAIKSRQAYLSERTIWSYSSTAQQFAAFARLRRVDSIDLVTSQLVGDWLAETAARKSWKGKTYNAQLGYLHTIFHVLVQRGHLANNPVHGLSTMPETDPEARYWTNAEIKLFFDHVEAHEPRFALAARLIYHCFLRPKEIRELRVKDLQADDCVILVRGETAKNNRTAPVTTPQWLAAMLAEHVRGAGGDDLIFSNDLLPGRVVLGRNYFVNIFNRVNEALKLPERCGLYGLKHSGNLYLLERGASLHDLYPQNRHHSPSQTDAYIRRLRQVGNPIFKDWER